MSLRDLTAPPSCPNLSQGSALSSLADNLLPHSSKTPFSQVASSSRNPPRKSPSSSSSTVQLSPTELALLQNKPISYPNSHLSFPPAQPPFSVANHVQHPYHESHYHYARAWKNSATEVFERAFQESPVPRRAIAHNVTIDGARPWQNAEFSPQERNDASSDLVAEFSRMHMMNPHHNQEKGKEAVGHREGTEVPLGWRRRYPIGRWGGMNGSVYGLRMENVVREQTAGQTGMGTETIRLESTTDTLKEEENEEAGTSKLTQSKSWGDEFTSLEGDVERESGIFGDEDTFERMYEAAFMDYVRRIPSAREYVFREKQAFEQSRSALDALEDGIRLRGLGRLGKAMERFEEALNRVADDPFPPLQRNMRSKAWFLLGITLAESDDDEMAIVALRKGLAEFEGSAAGEMREDNLYLKDTLMALAVSYTNELDQSMAFGHIKEWFEVWCREQREVPELGDSIEGAFLDATREGTNRLLRQLTAAAHRNPDDTDLHVIIGVLHNLHSEYKEAAGVLRHAVMLRPEDPSLWNKLGATLANGREFDDALRAYRRAVDINPAMVRAWVNVGTAYSNRQEYAKAVRYYLKSISLAKEHEEGTSNRGSTESQETTPQDRMAHVWGYLRTSLLSMSRADILPLVDARDLNGLRTHFNF
eukprot:GFKZ01007118.1.p1 GENE.GFKZ01007118.1~~GFKZ01007118.1.p1  ORF type:complete len:648 (-),score=85.63 GFKZ01007118.1:2179-4122(-)